MDTSITMMLDKTDKQLLPLMRNVSKVYSLGTNGLVVRGDGATTMGGRVLASSSDPAGKGKSDTPFGRTFSYNPFAWLCWPRATIFFLASRIKTGVPSYPETQPRTKTRSSVLSIRTTCKFCVVVRLPPIRPAIFFPGHTRPGSCELQIENQVNLLDRLKRT
jgi:hypothetical protein